MQYFRHSSVIYINKNDYMTIYLLGAFLLSTICGFVFTPVILDFCKRKKLYDIPNERKVHKKAIPRLGGISFFPSMMTAFVVLLFFLSNTQQQQIEVNIWSASFLMGTAVIYVVGIVDDLIGLNARTKFTAQLLTACLLPLSGLYVNNLYGLFGIHEIPYLVGIPLTVFLIVFIDNAINLIDGIDGLASGLSLIALTGFLVYFIHYDVFMHSYSILVCGMIGALVAFMYFNLFGKTERNNKIFMGDSGSLTLGFALGFLAMKCAMDNTLIWPTRPEAIIVPMSLLFVPSADVVRVTLHRLFHHRPIFDADKNHIHHKLLRLGMTQHQALIFIIALALFYDGMNYVLLSYLSSTWILIIDVLLYCFINMCINQFTNSHDMKRTIDCIVAFFCLIIFSPLILLCYLLIKLGGGSAIYKQTRIGLGGKPFYIYKFRSMVEDAEKEGEALFQHENETRMTKTGRFLRKHHLDELPQLWNVFVGDMSFVGYRPERPYYIKQIMEKDSRYELLYQIRPGVTSYATLYNGYTDTIEKMLKRLELDLYYLEHQTLWMDTKILLKTFLSIVSGRVFLFTSCLLLSPIANAQTTINYQLTAETAVGTGDYTAYQLATNRHHVLGTRSNTAYLRGAVDVEHAFTENLRLSGAVDAIASVHADHKAYLQQCYANLSYQSFFIEAGSREEEPVLRDPLLSSGAFVKGSNAKPVPQVHFGTHDFWTVPYTKDWLQVHFDFGYGKFMDSSYRKDVFLQEEGPNRQFPVGTDAYYHQKHLYLRSNPTKPLFVTVGIEHAVQFCGTKYSYEDGVATTKEKPASLKAFWDVILPVGDSGYFDNDAIEDWVYGNHIGSMTVQIGWNIDEHHQLLAYLDNPFEDGSGVRKSNGIDGLWGIQYTNKSTGIQHIRGAVVEYFQTTNQSGPLHWDSGDYPEPVRSQITDLVTGNDNYYNHNYYGSYSHYGMTFGNALVTSPIYNEDGCPEFRDNRIKAWHVGVNGDITNRLSYLVKGSYREGWGTYHAPLATKHHSFDAMLQGNYTTGPWQFSAAYAFDKGNIYGDCSTFNLKIGYYGKIL